MIDDREHAEFFNLALLYSREAVPIPLRPVKRRAKCTKIASPQSTDHEYGLSGPTFLKSTYKGVNPNSQMALAGRGLSWTGLDWTGL
ncbi:hypothetical protein GCM10027180_38740 [Microbulbifer echini]